MRRGATAAMEPTIRKCGMQLQAACTTANAGRDRD